MVEISFNIRRIITKIFSSHVCLLFARGANKSNFEYFKAVIVSMQTEELTEMLPIKHI